MTRKEVRAVLNGLDGIHLLLATLLYGTGLRLLECLRLRVKDIDFERRQVTVRDGGGFRPWDCGSAAGTRTGFDPRAHGKRSGAERRPG